MNSSTEDIELEVRPLLDWRVAIEVFWSEDGHNESVRQTPFASRLQHRVIDNCLEAVRHNKGQDLRGGKSPETTRILLI